MNLDEYNRLLNEIVLKYLNMGLNPWQQPWVSPYNFFTNKRYHSMNSLMLSLKSNELYENDPRWISYKQAMKMGYKVKKGEKGSTVFLYSNSYSRKKRNEDGIKIKDLSGNYIYEDIKTRPIFKTYYVFNAKQINNFPDLIINEVSDVADIDRAELISQKIPVSVKYEINDGAYYDPKKDEIYMPPKKNFYRLESFYSTLFHEAIHSTGSSKRLDRYSLSAYFSDYKNHCKEELVAELGALSLSQDCKFIYTNKNSVSYITSWAKSLKDDEFRLVDLYSDVSKALKYIDNPM